MNIKIKNIKRHEIISLIIILIVIVLANIIGSYWFTRFDLTTDKRYTISDATKELLKKQDDNLFFRIYLDGDFPAEFKRLKKETKEMLEEFRAYSKFIDYEFINPSESNDETERLEVERNLIGSGLIPYTINNATNSGTQQITIWPGAILTYRDKEIAIDLLSREMTQDEIIENSIQNLEYKLINAINKVTTTNKKTIAFVNGHGELNGLEINDIFNSLKENYIVKRTTLNEQLNALMTREYDRDSSLIIKPAFDAIIIAKPTEPFSEKDKFIIDQYIMYGGKVVWLVEPVSASMDSLMYSESTMCLPQNLNLDDQLFKYGVRLNKNLVFSSECAGLMLMEKQGGNEQLTVHPWCYFPLLFPASENPILNGVYPLKADFVSSIEPTTSAPEIEKTPLLMTYQFTGASRAPFSVSLNIINQFYSIKNEQDARRMFPHNSMVAAYLLTGRFTSLYENRMPEEITNSSEIGFKTKSAHNSMIVIADGDLIRNQLASGEYIRRVRNPNLKKGAPLPLGFDQYTGVMYGNKVFIENAISYLLNDNNGILKIKSRNIKTAIIDTNYINKNAVKLQIINVVLPSALMIILGLALAFIRKNKYNKTSWKRKRKENS